MAVRSARRAATAERRSDCLGSALPHRLRQGDAEGGGQWLRIRVDSHRSCRLLTATLDSPAWKAMSMGARGLYIALKRRVPKGRNQAFLSQRDAAKELGLTRTPTRYHFDELQHYGFIVMVDAGCLGVNGKGKAPRWRLTELGVTRKASAGDLFEPPTNDFLKWNGTRLRRPSPPPRLRSGPCSSPLVVPGKNRIPGPALDQGGPCSSPPLGPALDHSDGEVGPALGHRENPKWALHQSITSKPLPAEQSGGAAEPESDAVAEHPKKPWSKPAVADNGPRRFKRRRSGGRWNGGKKPRPEPGKRL